MQVRDRGDREIARVAAIQKGYMRRDQLMAAGLRRGSITHRLGTGRLRPRYRGVYLVDRVSPEPLGEEMAAVLHFGGYAILDRRCALALWGLLDYSGPVTVTLVGKQGKSRPGLRVHRVPHLDHRDFRIRQGLPLTSPARTIVDLAQDPDVEEAIAAAQMRGLASVDEIRAAAARAPGRRGVQRLLRLLDNGGSDGFTRSKGERRLRDLLRAAELPQPVANAPLLGYVADFLWPEQKLIVEVDGFQFHSSRQAFEHDRRRDQRLQAAGYQVIRVTWRQLEHEPFAVIARIAQSLAARAA